MDIRDKIVEPELVVKALVPVTEPLHLRTCAQAVDNNGKVYYLYCTEHTCRFFDLQRDGWHEHKPGYRPNRPSKNRGGAAHYMDIRMCGNKTCHLLIAHAWVHNRYDYIDPDTGKCSMQVDHRDGNPLNNDADNLEYVTADENNRRKNLFRRLRKIALDPSLLTSRQLSDIYNLPTEDDWIGIFLALFLELCDNDSSQMTIEAIRRNVAKALDALQKAITAGQKLPISIDIKSL